MNTVLRVRIYAAGSDTYSHNIRKTPPMCWMQRERESGETSTVSVAVWSVWLLHAARATGTEFQTVDAAKEAACNWVSGSIQSTDNDWMNADSDGWRRRKTMWKNPRGSGDPFAVKKQRYIDTLGLYGARSVMSSQSPCSRRGRPQTNFLTTNSSRSLQYTLCYFNSGPNFR